MASQNGACPPYVWGPGRIFRPLTLALAIAASVTLSGCAATSSTPSSTSGNSSAYAASTTPGAAAAPSGPAQPSSVTPHDVSLSWNASISSGVLGYNVYRASGSGGPYMKLNSSIVFATNYTDNAVQSGQIYYYVVTATNSGDLESAYSNEIAAVIP